ncbi:MAG: hypothetical protein HY059_02210 [Proteobacteria bacterium]|nr:hypothetical protein [Pseudomonadota bacterium]
MIGLPEILSVKRTADDKVVLRIALPPDAPAFAGHFRDQPILAGVIQIDWALRLAGEHLGIAQPAARDFQIKFRRPVRPDAALFLQLNRDATKRLLSFEYRIGDELATVGKIKLETAS